MRIFENFISEQALPNFTYLCREVSNYKEDLFIDGIKAFNPKSQFVEGKVINAFSYLLINKQDSEEFSELVSQFQEAIHFVSNRKFETWGTLNCLTGLYRLAQHDLLTKIVSQEDLMQLKDSLTWYHFVDESNNFALINKPTNYYGVAFGISRYRELLGWSSENYSETFLNLLMNHIKKYSGEHMVMDETQGQGRFDRYSLLIPAELSNLLTETKVPVPTEIIEMLKKSVSVCLMIANNFGDGIMYGRSIGAYGDTAVLEILSIANRLELLTEDEQIIAFGYSQKIVSKFCDFWFNKETNEVNMWDFGRQTDEYRNKNRILGETLSLQLQIIHSIENFMSNPIDEFKVEKRYNNLLSELPMKKVFVFDESNGLKLLVVVRTKKRIFMVPFINGGEKYYRTSPYLPMPMSTRLLEFTPDTLEGNLIPLIIKDNHSYLPIAPFEEIKVIEENKSVIISFTTTKFSNVDEGNDDKEVDNLNIKYEGVYRFTDSFLSISGKLIGVDLIGTTYSIDLPLFEKVESNKDYIFETVSNKRIKMEKFDMIDEKVIKENTYETPHGAHKTVLVGRNKVNNDVSYFELKINF